MHIVYLLSVLIIGKDIFKNIKRQVIRAIEGEIQSQAVTGIIGGKKRAFEWKWFTNIKQKKFSNEQKDYLDSLSRPPLHCFLSLR